MAFKPHLSRLVPREFLRAVYAWIRRQARKLGVRRSHCGSVTFVQRFGSDLRLNVHFHALVLDGIYAQGPRAGMRIPPSTRLARGAGGAATMRRDSARGSLGRNC